MRPKVEPFGKRERSEMLDLLMIAITVAFFIACIAYVRGCESL